MWMVRLLSQQGSVFTRSHSENLGLLPICTIPVRRLLWFLNPHRKRAYTESVRGEP
jgi:hypothetical protein